MYNLKNLVPLKSVPSSKTVSHFELKPLICLNSSKTVQDP